MDGRLRAYVSGEYEHSDRVRNSDIPIMRRQMALLQNDLDPNAQTPDGVIDALVFDDLQLITTSYGGNLTLAHNTALFPSAADPDIPNTPCSNQGVTLDANCFIMDPGVSFGREMKPAMPGSRMADDALGIDRRAL